MYAVIDADLQHPPEALIPLIYEACNGTDIAIGSRYAGEKGKDTFGDFKLHRKIMSKGANMLAKILVPKVANVKDIQSGFFAMKKSVIEDVELKPSGYKILLEILAMGKYKVVKEVGYDFGKREHGSSKLGATTIFDYLYHLMSITLRDRESKRLAKFLVTGVVGIVVTVGLLWFMTEKMGIFYLISAGISKEIGILLSFGLNEVWVFNDRITSSMKSTKEYASRLLQFNVNRLLSIFIVITSMAIFTELLGINYIISNLIGIGIAFPFNYIVSNGKIWKNDDEDCKDLKNVDNA